MELVRSYNNYETFPMGGSCIGLIVQADDEYPELGDVVLIDGDNWVCTGFEEHKTQPPKRTGAVRFQPEPDSPRALSNDLLKLYRTYLKHVGDNKPVASTLAAAHFLRDTND